MPELDPRIITGIGENYARLPSINEGIAQRQGIQMRDMAMGQQQQEQAFAMQDRATAAQNKTRMAELLPGAARGDKAAIAEMYHIDPTSAAKWDTQQREQAKAGLDDLASAVIWAQSDDAKWDQMINFYSKANPEFEKYRGHREYAPQALMALGQMDKMLSASKQQVITPQPGAGAFSITPGLPGSGVETLVAPNDGTQRTGAPVNGGGAGKTIGGVTYYQDANGQWHDAPPTAGGGASNGTGGFPR